MFVLYGDWSFYQNSAPLFIWHSLHRKIPSEGEYGDVCIIVICCAHRQVCMNRYLTKEDTPHSQTCIKPVVLNQFRIVAVDDAPRSGVDSPLDVAHVPSKKDNMPSELLHIPPLYTLVGLYRLFTDPFIRQPVFDKVKHATVRGLVVGALYAVGSWKVMRWVVKTFIVGGPGIWFGLGAAKRRVEQSVGSGGAGKVYVGLGGIGGEVDLVLCAPNVQAHSATRN